MTAAEYLAGPCMASSLPWWKTESVPIPEHMSVVRDDLFFPDRFPGYSRWLFKGFFFYNYGGLLLTSTFNNVMLSPYDKVRTNF